MGEGDGMRESRGESRRERERKGERGERDPGIERETPGREGGREREKERERDPGREREITLTVGFVRSQYYHRTTPSPLFLQTKTYS